MKEKQLKKIPGEPLYETLYKGIVRDITNGQLKPGEKMPSKRVLATELEISITTVENAYAQLLLEGYIYSEPARGYYVGVVDLPNIQAEPEQRVFAEEKESTEEKYIVDFKANRTPLELFPLSVWSRVMRKTLSDENRKLLETVPYNGIFPLRRAIAEYLHKSRNMLVDPAQIIIGAGTEYLYSRLLQLLGQDSIFAIEDPGYKKFADITNSQGTLWDYIPIDEQGIRVDRLRASRANIVHVSPANHFPTGTVMPIPRRMELLHWANEDSDRFIIEDDYDSEIRYSGRMIPSVFSIDQNEKVIYMNTFSKSLVPSIRISYMVLPPRLMRRYQETLSFYSCTVSSFEQMTLATFISEGYFERHINTIKQHYRKNRDELIRRLQNSPVAYAFRIKESNAGTHFLLQIETNYSDEQIREIFERNGMHFAMLSDYERVHSLKNARTIVVNYASLDKETMRLAVKILEEVLIRYLASRPKGKNGQTDI